MPVHRRLRFGQLDSPQCLGGDRPDDVALSRRGGRSREAILPVPCCTQLLGRFGSRSMSRSQS
jgi:hypothetical protein